MLSGAQLFLMAPMTKPWRRLIRFRVLTMVRRKASHLSENGFSPWLVKRRRLLELNLMQNSRAWEKW
ncbi:MAG: hypothetical protein JW395_4055 [Nitrospira sp.]|nr:hypothetical protein [Nitrospira sp.]